MERNEDDYAPEVQLAAQARPHIDVIQQKLKQS